MLHVIKLNYMQKVGNLDHVGAIIVVFVTRKGNNGVRTADFGFQEGKNI